MANTIPLTNDVIEVEPATFEEWVAIHGEPEYVDVPVANPNFMGISVIDCHQDDEEVDTTGIFTLTKSGDLELDYKRFLEVFTQINSLSYCNGVFYTPQGSVSRGSIRQDIHFSLEDMGWKKRFDVPVDSIYKSLQSRQNVEQLPVSERIIPLANGDLHLKKEGGEFHLEEFGNCAYRLSVNYSPVKKTMPLFQKWLNDVFMPCDIPTVQDIFGYCLVPVTSAQEAFIFVGDGGAGKSGVGAILNGLLGNGFTSTEIQKLVEEKFQTATIENKLVAYDDDLGSAALAETGELKKLISADTPIKAERKYADPHEFVSYCRIIASANFMLSSLYDDSDGFFRRLHPIHVKPKDPNRKDIRGFYEMILSQEKEAIFQWALEGLRRVMDNGWKITWSERSREYLAVSKSNSVHFPEFLKDTCDFCEAGDVSTAEIKKVYKNWCKENGIKEAGEKRFERWLGDNAEKLGFVPHKHIKRGGKDVRGYKRIALKPEWDTSRIVF